MEQIIAERMADVPRSFIREILKVSLDPEIISFAGGLPNAAFFPVAEIDLACRRVFAKFGASVLQYSRSEGDGELRQYIAARYKEKKDLEIDPDCIIITNGSQQGIDLLGKVLLNRGDSVLLEEPGYLGAIQSLSLFKARFLPIPLADDGLDLAALTKVSGENHIKMLYTVPVFQNPSGVSYTDENKEQVAALAGANCFVIVEDDPYGELRFAGNSTKSFSYYLPEQTVLLGSFSKIVSPGFRLGWIVAPPWLYEKLIIAKQAADLHTSTLAQKVMVEYLQNNDLDRHIAKIIEAYGGQCRAMQTALAGRLPKSITFTKPQGGMFLWGRLPNTLDSMEVFHQAVQEKVVFVPGNPFYTTNGNTSTFRLSFSCVDPQTIEEGVERLAKALAPFKAQLE